MGIKTPPYPNYPQWTQARFWTFIRSALRAAWNRYPVKYEAINRAFVKKAINPKSGREAKMYRCAICNNVFVVKDVEVDHINPTGTLKTYADLPQFVRNLFCSVDELNVLCKECHQKKTQKERADARISG